MTDISDLPGVVDEMRRSLIEDWDELPVDLREELFKLGGVGTSPVDRIVKGAEAVYKAADAGVSLPVKTMSAAAGAFRTAANFGFHGMNNESRGNLAADVLEGKSVPADKKPVPVGGRIAPPSPIN